MTRARLDLGRCGEDLALRHIEKLGYRIIERNYRCALGELDLVARDGDTLVFIEIKTRRQGAAEAAKEAVDARKRRQLSKAALAYLKAHGGWETRARFDVVTVGLEGAEPKVELIRNAFDLAYG